MENQGLPRALVTGIAGLIFIVLFGSSMFVTIEPGEKGVLFKKFAGGLDKETVYPQGFHIIAPWNTMHVYDVKLKDTFEKMEVLSKNGLSIKIDLSFRYQPVASQIGFLHDNIGKDYLERIIKPEIRSVILTRTEIFIFNIDYYIVTLVMFIINIIQKNMSFRIRQY